MEHHENHEQLGLDSGATVPVPTKVPNAEFSVSGDVSIGYGGTDEKKREEFLREANMLKTLHHPNIMQVANVMLTYDAFSVSEFIR